ncbi:MAG: bifunctional isocitrate dehydrogenase kinase/phosphatase [Betaproteobacteria bacterium]|nr:bifunctional isocitrate dehydrogenase kinase/phosphatase [Betaproteobacteria bacterium]
MSIAADIARTILAGFDKHYRLFREISTQARDQFERADWAAGRETQKTRIQMYDQRVTEGVDAVLLKFPSARHDEGLWPRIKLEYIGLLYNHLQPELAETFYNSVACRVLHRDYYHNDYIFWRPATSTEFLEGSEPTYRSHYPNGGGLRRMLLEMVTGFGLKNPFENLRRDVRCLMQALDAHFPQPWKPQVDFQVQVLGSLFYRNKAAHIVGRAINGNRDYPFVIPILQNERGELYLDTLLLKPEHLAVFFSFARAYFMVDMEVPSAYVTFLRKLVPNKPLWEFYTLLGLQKQGKTMFYRDLFHHLRHSTDNFIVAPGIKGMVMLVFTLPSFPYVFKVIRDYFAPPKDVNRETVLAKYLLVKYHDRVGRMADTLEYSYVALPVDRFDPQLLEELKTYAASSIEFEGERVVIKHMYIERRMIPLNLYLDQADEGKMEQAVKEYGNAIKDLAGANIFPGDMLLKNFGWTRHGRVVFYDYDEISYMTECNFRRMPKARSMEDELASEPWYAVGPDDVFPEEFPTFLFTDPRARDLFRQYHGDLADAEYWIGVQNQIKAGVQQDVFPYPEELRFCNRFAGKGAERPKRPSLAAVK